MFGKDYNIRVGRELAHVRSLERSYRTRSAVYVLLFKNQPAHRLPLHLVHPRNARLSLRVHWIRSARVNRIDSPVT